MGLWHIGSSTDLSDMYQPYVGPFYGAEYPPQPWPSWFKGVYRSTIDPYWARVFFYIPSEDMYCLWTVRHDYPNFIGIFYPYGPIAVKYVNVKLYFKGESGEFFDWRWASDAPIFPDMPAWGFYGGSIGSYERLYITTTAWAYPCCYEVYWQSLTQSGWEVCATYDTVPSTVLGPWGPIPIVNREDGYICWGGGNKFNLFHLESDDLWHRFGVTNVPAKIQAGTYENRKTMWWVSDPASGHKVGKLNYQTGKHEILTSVQPQYDDVTKNLIAFDTKRKRVAILRARPDDPTTGACRWAMDFYRPIIKVAADGLTDPVPMVPQRVGNRVYFKSHLIGDVGEPLAPHSVDAVMEAPVEGRLLTPMVTSDSQGKLMPMYQALATGSEKLTLSAEITDGDPDTMERG